METVIYADILFIINLIIDGMCLAVTAVLQKRRLNKWRLGCASVLGGLYSVAAVALNGLNTLLTVIIHIAVAFILCITAVKHEGVKGAVADTAWFFFINAVLGGVLYSIYTLCGCFAVYNGIFYAEVSAVSLIASGVIVLTVALFCITRAKKNNAVRCCDFYIEFRGKSCTLNCMYDSGNLLICPYTALPVAVISRKAARHLFTEQELEVLDGTPAIRGVRPLPAKGIGGDVMLPSFLPDKAEVRAFGDRLFTARQLCVAIKRGGDGFGKTDGIVPV